MVDLIACSIADQLGLIDADPVQMAELPGQYLVTSHHDLAPNSLAEWPDGYACWLTPTRCLAVTTSPPAGFASDVSDGQAVFTFGPPHDAALLAMGGTLPPDALAEGRCAQTLFAGVKVLLYRRHGLVHLHVDRPLAPYLLTWFRQAASAL